jgi:conjugative transfer relaxase protein TraI
MLSISSIKGDAGYYSHEDNYYASGALDDRWVGEGAALLGLEGKVSNIVMDEVRQGKLPDGSDLSRMVDGKNTHRSGYDLTFSAPKSVSIMALVAQDRRFIDIHNRAVDTAMSEVEQLISTRITENGVTETVLTGNMVAALYNHDTSRDLDPQVHTHALVFNATFAEDKWRSLASDTRMKTGFGETLFATQIALGKIYQNVVRREVEALGFETEVTGKNGLWEIKGVPVEPFSRRSQAINEAAGPDASRASRDVAALDTREAKAWADPDLLIKDWQRRLTDNGYEFQDAREAAASRVAEAKEPGRVAEQGDKGEGSGGPGSEIVSLAIADTISSLSDKKVQFTWSELLAGTVNRLPAEEGVFALARAGLDQAIDGQRLIPLDREKGIFTSDIHLLNELSVQHLAREAMQGAQVLTFPEQSVPRGSPTGDAVAVLSQDRHPLAILSAKGGAQSQRNRIIDAAEMAREQGREVVVLTSDARSGRYLSEETQLKDNLMQRSGLKADATFPVQSTLIVEQAEKLTLKETLLILEKARDAGAQVLLMDTENRQGTGNALSVLKSTEVPQYQQYADKQPDIRLVSEPDKRQRYAALASEYVRLSAEGRDVVAQVSGPREQTALTENIRTARQNSGELSRESVAVKVLEPVWLDSKSRRQRDNYHEGMVMEQWDKEDKTMSRYTIDRVAEHNNSLVLKAEDGSTSLHRISQLDGSWSLYRPQTLNMAAGERLRVLGREAGGKLKAGTELTVTRPEGGQLVVQAGNNEQSLDTGRALKIGYRYVEGVGQSTGDDRTVLAAVPAGRMNKHTLTQLGRSGSEVHLYTPLDEDRATRRLGLTPQSLQVSEQVMQSTGEKVLASAMDKRRESLMSSAELAVTLAIPRSQAGGIEVGKTQLLADAMDSGVDVKELKAEIDRQIEAGSLMSTSSVPGAGNGVLVPRAAYEMEKSIIRHVAEGKGAVSSLLAVPPASVLEGLTSGQREATRMILESNDRFTAIQGYAGVGKTTQFRAVMTALSVLSPEARPEVIGLGPTHRAVHEMQGAGVKGQTLSSFLSETRAMMSAGETPDFRNTLFLTDESSMVGNRDAAELYRLVAAGGGRMVSSGDDAQLQAISSGQPFRLVQQRSAIDTVVMQEIVRQTPELRPAIESMIAGNVSGALQVMETVQPSQVPRREGAWIPETSVEEIKVDPKATETGQRALRAANAPGDITSAVVADWAGRTPEAQQETIIIAHLNADRRDINRMIHDVRHERGEVGQEERTYTVLIPERVPDNALRSGETFAPYKGSVAMVNSHYYRVEGVNEDNVVTLRDADGKALLISAQENSSQDISLFREDSVTVSEGDRVRFSRSDNDRGYVANSIWTVSGFTEEGGVRFRHGEQEKVLMPGNDVADRHIDLAYAVTAYGAQGASARYEISLEGTDRARLRMASLESAYVTMSRAKEHAQIYTDDRSKWQSRAAESSAKMSAHDILHQAEDRQGELGAKILSWSSPLNNSALGRRVLSENGLEGESLARFVAPMKKYPSPHVALPVWSSNGRDAGVLLTEIRLTEEDRRLAIVTPDDSRLMGGEGAQFAGLQRSRNGETLIAPSIEHALQVAQDNPESGVVIRLSGEENEPLRNMRRLTGGSAAEPDIQEAVLQAAAQQATAEETPLALPDREDTGPGMISRQQDSAVQQVANSPDIPFPDIPDYANDYADTDHISSDERAMMMDIASEYGDSMEDAVRDVASHQLTESLSPEQMQRIEREFVVELPEKDLLLEEKTLGE